MIISSSTFQVVITNTESSALAPLIVLSLANTIIPSQLLDFFLANMIISSACWRKTESIFSVNDQRSLKPGIALGIVAINTIYSVGREGKRSTLSTDHEDSCDLRVGLHSCP